MKYPIGIQSFEDIRTGGYCYVDKTALILRMVNEGKIYFLSRPRRFGKSLLISTMECYFRGRKELFEGLAINDAETDWLEHPVFHIDFNGVSYTEEGALYRRIEEYLEKWEAIYGKDSSVSLLGSRFMSLIRRAYEQTGHKAVVLIDEYDKPLLDVLDSGLKSNNGLLLEEEHRELLRGFYSTLKASDDYLKFVFLTGVTKFAQVAVFSGLNQLKDITLDRRYDTLCGISMEELTANFKQPIHEFAEELHITDEQMIERLKTRYDGYHFARKMTDVFNPFSLLNAFDCMEIRDFWFATGSPTYLVRLIEHFNQPINKIVEKEYFESDFLNYKADQANPLPILFQSGYLTIKAFDPITERYRLDFPNQEVRAGLLPLLLCNYLKIDETDTCSAVIDLSRALETGNLNEFCNIITSFLSSIPYDSHNSLKEEKATEKFFHYTFYLMLRLMGSYRVTTRVEERQAEGRVDCTAETSHFVYIFEFKLDSTAQVALQQIKDKNYALPFAASNRKIILVGANFSSEKRTITDWAIEEYHD